MDFRKNDGCILESILSALQEPKGVKSAVLQTLYSMLSCFSVNPQWSGSDLDELVMDIDGGVAVEFGLVRKLSDVLCTELSRRFEQFFSSLGDVCTSKDVGDSGLLLEMGVDAEVLLLLLRCSLVGLILLGVENNLVLEHGRILLGILRKLCSSDIARKKAENIRFEQLVCQARRRADVGCTTSSMENIVASLQFMEPSDSLFSFFSSIVEVFLDEVAVHRQLREYLKLIDSAFPPGEKLCTHSCLGNTGVLVEMLCCHFEMYFSDEKAIEGSVYRLFWVHEEDLKHSLKAPELSLTAATLLLLNPVVLSAPKYMLAHVVSLVSEACMVDLESRKPSHRLTSCFLSVFEKSVILFREYTSTLQIGGVCGNGRAPFAKANMSGRKSEPSFESCMSSDRRKKINYLLSVLDDNSKSQLQNLIVGMKSEMVNSTIQYVKKSQNVLAISYQDEVLSILSNLILGVSDGFSDIHGIEEGSLEDIYLLSSVLKLMGTSLLSAIFCLSHSNHSGCFRTLKDFSSCKEYDFILTIANCFNEFSIHVPIQQHLYDMMDTFSMRHKGSKMMLIHFSGLLSLTFASGLDCLAKGFLLVIKAVLNLFIFEEGNLDALQPLIDCSKECLAYGSPLVKVHESVAHQNSSLVVASKFQKIRALHSRVVDALAISYSGGEDGPSESPSSVSALQSMDDILAMEEETEETTNGEMFLKCVLDNKSVSDFDDLADFIECKQGKDYDAWIKNRQRYRSWKCEKMAVLRWKRKKKTWKLVKGKKT